MKEKVVIAMSGGVDSSVAAAMLVEAGYDVIGVSMQLWDYSEAEGASTSTAGSCCSLDDLYDARRVADFLRIPYYVMNMEADFKREVVDYFVNGYLSGETPNPCAKCNQELKFKTLLRKARELNATKLATGHYARIVGPADGGGFRLMKAADATKDQTYFLFAMTQDELKSVLFPLGDITKARAREYAVKLGLRTAHKRESQDICFVTGGSYADFISSTGSPDKPGEIVDTLGKVIGLHDGLYKYTIGQRKGLGIGGEGGPYYVLALDLANNKLVVGSNDELMNKGLVARGAHWINDAPAPGERLIAKVRYGHAGAESEVFAEGDRVTARFLTKERAVTPGQAVVFYRGDEVVGGGWIERALDE